MMTLYQKFELINTFIFDIDGVWTSGSLDITEEGDLLRTMDAKDGYACRKAIDEGYHMAIITGGYSKGVINRLESIGITEIHTRISRKYELLQKLASENRINPNTTMYVGDDILDKDCMENVLLAACPFDAVSEIIDISDYISPFSGGHGCVRDVIEKVLRIQDKW